MLRRIDLPDGTVIKYAPVCAPFIKEIGGVKQRDFEHIHGNSNTFKERKKKTTEALKLVVNQRAFNG